MTRKSTNNSHQSMWQGTIVLVFILAAFLLLARPSAALDPQDDQDANVRTLHIVQLADESLAQNLKCRSFLDQVKSISSTSQKKEYFVSRDSAVKVLELAGKYPGTPLATNEAVDQFLSMTAYPKGEKLTDLNLALNRLGDCYSVEFYGVLSRLIHPRTQALLTSQELTREQHLVLSYIEHESISGTKVFVQVANLVDLFDHSIRQKLILPHPENREIIENLKWTLAKIKTEGASRFAKVEESKNLLSGDSSIRTEALDDLSWQLNQMDDIQDSLRDAAEIELEEQLVPQKFGILANGAKGN